MVGITGTNGKSTVTTLVGALAERAGVARARRRQPRRAGARPARAAGRRDLYVLELSSFQLETTHSLQLEAAAVLNVTPDHLDRYATLADYAAAKARIFDARRDRGREPRRRDVVRMPRPGQRGSASACARATRTSAC